MDSMETLIPSEKYMNHSLPIAFAEVLKKRGAKLFQHDHSAPCGDWKTATNVDDKMVHVSEYPEDNSLPEANVNLNSLPNLPIDFDDQKSVNYFLEKTTPLIKVLFHVRKPIAGYQQAKLNQNSSLTFSALLSVIYINTSAAILTIAMLIYNLMPLLDVGLYVCRFIIDKTIEIVDTEDRYDFYMKAFIFICEVAFVSLMIVVLTSIIIFPILSLVSQIVIRAIHIIA